MIRKGITVALLGASVFFSIVCVASNWTKPHGGVYLQSKGRAYVAMATPQGVILALFDGIDSVTFSNTYIDGIRAWCGERYFFATCADINLGLANKPVASYPLRSWSAPLWAILPLLLLYPCITIVRGPLRRWRRRRRCLCVRCGYNLAGNMSGTCPECGATVDRLRA